MNISCGVDIGARTIGIVLFNGTEIVEAAVVDTGANPQGNAVSLFESMLEHANISKKDVLKTLATGYGRNYFTNADRVASEILCQAKGVAFLFPSARTVIDIGGQDSKMIAVAEHGKVTSFVMNDRCAAGTGKFIEMVAATLNIPLVEMGSMAMQTLETCEISSMCAVFAESEIIGLLHKGVPAEVILRSVFKSIAKRTVGMAGRITLQDTIIFTGGVAKNEGVCEALQQEINSTKIKIPANPQITGALGAAILAMDGLKSSGSVKSSIKKMG